jgi:hypothetical protein
MIGQRIGGLNAFGGGLALGESRPSRGQRRYVLNRSHGRLADARQVGARPVRIKVTGVARARSRTTSSWISRQILQILSVQREGLARRQPVVGNSVPA